MLLLRPREVIKLTSLVDCISPSCLRIQVRAKCQTLVAILRSLIFRNVFESNETIEGREDEDHFS